MAVSSNPKIPTDGLVLALDPADTNSYRRLSAVEVMVVGGGGGGGMDMGGGGTTHRNIGSRGSGGDSNWVGNIDVVNFYNRALLATEVSYQYNTYRTRFGI